jgi:hypothetical protein
MQKVVIKKPCNTRRANIGTVLVYFMTVAGTARYKVLTFMG